MSDADLPAITDLFARWDAAHLGHPEHDEREVGEILALVPPGQLEFARADGRLVGIAYFGGGSAVLVDPDAPDEVRTELLDWYESQPANDLEVLATDTALREALAARGWTYDHSSVELMRNVTPEWALAEPEWPDGIDVRDLAEGDAEAIHHLIYVDAGWAEIPGHPARPFGAWRSIFLTEQERPEQQVLAWRDGSLVGVSIGRTWSDGTGWVSQLAVARSQRGRGLGRALLLESLRRRVAAGATALGLSVEVVNRRAVTLYLDVGLEIAREWMTYLR